MRLVYTAEVAAEGLQKGETRGPLWSNDTSTIAVHKEMRNNERRDVEERE